MVPASFFTFSIIFCFFAWAGAPEDANAPPSAMTSFCKSWMMSAVFSGLIFRSAIALLAHLHVCDGIPANFHLNTIDRRRARTVDLVPHRSTPVQLSRVLGRI